MATTPQNATRYPVSTDSANLAQYYQNIALDVDDNLITRHASTAARNSAITAPVDGQVCAVAGVLQKRAAGTWIPVAPRVIARSVAPASSIIAGGSNETGFGAIAGLTSFTMYGAGAVLVTATFRAGTSGAAATCTVKIDGATVGFPAVSRDDITVSVTGAVALATGSHTVALRVDVTGATASWTNAYVTITELSVE